MLRMLKSLFFLLAIADHSAAENSSWILSATSNISTLAFVYATVQSSDFNDKTWATHWTTSVASIETSSVPQQRSANFSTVINTASSSSAITMSEIIPYKSSNKNSATNSIATNGSSKVSTPPAPRPLPTLSPHLLRQLQMEPICWAVALIFVFASLLLLILLKLPKSTKFFCHRMLLASYTLCLIANFITSIHVQVRLDKHRGWCTFHRVWYSYISLTLYSCMFVEGIQICLMLTSVFESRSKKWQHIVYFFIGWILPGMIVLIEFAVLHENFRNDPLCQSLKNRWIWKAPALTFISANIICFCYILFVAARKIMDSRKYSGTFEKALGSIRSMLVIFPLLGITFLFGFFVQEGIAFGYVFILAYALLGILFFVFHVVFDSQVRSALMKDVFGIKPGASKTSQTTETVPATTPILSRHPGLEERQPNAHQLQNERNNNADQKSLHICRATEYNTPIQMYSSANSYDEHDEEEIGIENRTFSKSSSSSQLELTLAMSDLNTRL